ncbi:MAG: hypothetical protein AAGF94_16130 [Pseudomonadota bacterium]
MPSMPRSARPKVMAAFLAWSVSVAVASPELAAKTLSPGNRNCQPHCDTIFLDSLNDLSEGSAGSLFGPIDQVQSDSLFGGDGFLTAPSDDVPEALVPGTPVETDVAPIISDD